MCAEKRQGGRGRGRKHLSTGERSLSLTKNVNKSKCSLVKKTEISEKTAKKLKSTKLKPRKLQMNVKQHTDIMNV